MASRSSEETAKAERIPETARLKWRAFGVACALTGVGMVVALGFAPLVGMGIILGGTAGVAGYWLLAHSLWRLSEAPSERLSVQLHRSLYRRLILYAAALIPAYFLDRTHLHAFAGAVGALLASRYILLFLGIRGFRDK